ncbi:hypothetical protein HMSP1_52 [Sinorhizobium phage HMSP1-Susan]|nr:hypothetical protein HMSP1_52 [Sinorhizobium phage HMSP1-Susan]
MMKLSAPPMLLCLLLSGCASTPGLTLKSADIKGSVPFCDVARKEWGVTVTGDPVKTQAQKAAYNATGEHLECWN